MVDGDEIEINSLRLDLASAKRGHAVIETAGKRHRNFRHGFLVCASSYDAWNFLTMNLLVHRSQGLPAMACMVLSGIRQMTPELA